MDELIMCKTLYRRWRDSSVGGDSYTEFLVGGEIIQSEGDYVPGRLDIVTPSLGVEKEQEQL